MKTAIITELSLVEGEKGKWHTLGNPYLRKPKPIIAVTVAITMGFIYLHPLVVQV
jgi:hypothetical protein